MARLRFNCAIATTARTMLLTAAACMTMWSCAQAPTKPPEATVSARLESITSGGAFLVEWQATPSPIPLNRMFELDITVKTLQSVDDRNPVWLKVDAQMPEHNHGMNTRVVTEELGEGRFRAHGLLFHMAGEWIVSFEVAKGARFERTEIKLDIE